jgi:putative transposase
VIYTIPSLSLLVLLFPLFGIGTTPSPSTVSRVFHTLEAEFETWQKRTLPCRYAYVFADDTYFSVIYDGEGQKMPILALIGITVAGQREVIACNVGERENQGAWENLLTDIKARGVQEVGLWITNGDQAMLNAIELKFPTAPRQRCIKRKMDNLLSHVPEEQRETVRQELRAIFYQKNRAQADQVATAFRNEGSCLLLFYAVVRTLRFRKLRMPG